MAGDQPDKLPFKHLLPSYLHGGEKGGSGARLRTIIFPFTHSRTWNYLTHLPRPPVHTHSHTHAPEISSHTFPAHLSTHSKTHAPKITSHTFPAHLSTRQAKRHMATYTSFPLTHLYQILIPTPTLPYPCPSAPPDWWRGARDKELIENTKSIRTVPQQPIYFAWDWTWLWRCPVGESSLVIGQFSTVINLDWHI